MAWRVAGLVAALQPVYSSQKLPCFFPFMTTTVPHLCFCTICLIRADSKQWQGVTARTNTYPVLIFLTLSPSSILNSA